jgi:F-type H+-transporting ATPase subunit a
VPKRRTLLGCSFPLAIAISLIVLALFIIGFIAGPLGRSLLSGVQVPSWLSVAKPVPELPADKVFQILGLPITNTLLASWVTIVFLVLFSFLVTRSLRVVPRRWQMVLEYIVGALLDFCRSVAGEKNGRHFFPIVATIFLFVAFNAWLALLPGYGSITIAAGGHEVHLLRAANTDINTPLAVALVSFVTVFYFGFRLIGISYLAKFANVGDFFTGVKQTARGNVKAGLSGMFLGVINIFIGVIETLSEFIRIISFTFRLFGNMTAGEILLLMATFLIPFVFTLPFYGLELLVGFVQALIFAGLTLIFLTVAVSAHGGENHSEEHK